MRMVARAFGIGLLFGFTSRWGVPWWAIGAGAAAAIILSVLTDPRPRRAGSGLEVYPLR